MRRTGAAASGLTSAGFARNGFKRAMHLGASEPVLSRVVSRPHGIPLTNTEPKA